MVTLPPFDHYFSGGVIMIEKLRHDSLRSALMITAVAVLAAAGIGSGAAGAQNNPTIGSPNTVTASPGVPRPATTPCTVALFTNQQFADFNPKDFNYTPPADCPGPWAKVVLEVDLSIDAGNQFDRTAQISLGNVNIYYGTTAEPYSNFGPSWHVERDLTDYSALFTTPQSGNANLGNLVNSTYTSVLTGSATLQFYPPSPASPAPRTADTVLSLSTAPGGAATLSTGADVLAPTLNLPTNIEQAYLDVIAQSQNDDEFWYTCVPDSGAKLLDSCGGTAYRRHRPRAVVAAAGDSDAQLPALPRRPHAFRQPARRRQPTPGGDQRLQRRRLLPG
jgi:Peptide N-acetyl-beta-D-glucosaminyl asparaginase amidase A